MSTEKPELTGEPATQGRAVPSASRLQGAGRASRRALAYEVDTKFIHLSALSKILFYSLMEKAINIQMKESHFKKTLCVGNGLQDIPAAVGEGRGESPVVLDVTWQHTTLHWLQQFIEFLRVSQDAKFTGAVFAMALPSHFLGGAPGGTTWGGRPFAAAPKTRKRPEPPRRLTARLSPSRRAPRH